MPSAYLRNVILKPQTLMITSSTLSIMIKLFIIRQHQRNEEKIRFSVFNSFVADYIQTLIPEHILQVNMTEYWWNIYFRKCISVRSLFRFIGSKGLNDDP